MKRLLLSLLCGGLLGHMAQAQDAHSLLFSQPGSLRASTLSPASLRLDGNRHVMLGTLSLNGWVTNNGGNLPLSARFLSGEQISESHKDELLGDMPDVLRIGAGAQIMSLGAGLQLHNATHMAFSFTATDRGLASVQLNKSFMDFMLRGNRHLAGQNVDLAKDLAISAQWLREYAVGYAMDLPFLSSDAVQLRAGLRLKYLTNQFAAQSEGARLEIYTHPDGEYIDAKYDYALYLTTGEVGPFQSRGGGMGLDLSVEATINDKLRINASVLDIGSITVDKDLELYRGRGNERYEQLIVGALFWDDRFNNASDEERQSYPLAPDTLLLQSVTMALPTRLLVNSQLGLGDAVENAYGINYHKHNLYLAGTFLLKPAAGYRHTAFVSAAYAYHLKGILRLGGSLCHPGYAPVGIGAFAGLDTGFFQAGLASENLLPLLRKDALAGGDLMFNLSFAF
jgi:hypothetical protein